MAVWSRVSAMVIDPIRVPAGTVTVEVIFPPAAGMTWGASALVYVVHAACEGRGVIETASW